MNAIIVCGGLSSRLGDITKSLPKVLLDVGGKTVLERQVEKLKNEVGITEVILAAGHLSEVLRSKVGNEICGVKIIYAVEEKKLGTGGAIKFALSLINNPEEPTFVLNGDILTSASFFDMIKYLKPESDGIILASYVPDVFTYGTLEYDDNFHLSEFREKDGVHKPGYQNGGIYLFNPQMKKYFPAADAFSMEYDVFPNMKDVFVYESDKDWIDVGVPDRLEAARESYRFL